MKQTLLVSSLVLTLLGGGAVAQPAPPKPAPAPSRTTPYKMKFAVTDGADTRTYELVLLDDTCGSVEERVGDRKDEIKVCARLGSTPTGARVEVAWKLHTKTLDHEVNYQAVVAKGTPVEVGRTNGARFTLTLI